MSIERGSLGYLERYPDVLEYAAKNIPGFHAMSTRQTLGPMNKLFGTNFADNSLIEDSLKHWQTILQLEVSQKDGD